MADHRIHLDQPDQTQMEIFRKMTGAQRLAVAAGLLRSARRMLRAHLADVHPDWDADQIEREVARRIASGHR